VDTPRWHAADGRLQLRLDRGWVSQVSAAVSWMATDGDGSHPPFLIECFALKDLRVSRLSRLQLKTDMRDSSRARLPSIVRRRRRGPWSVPATRCSRSRRESRGSWPLVRSQHTVFSLSN
jgi:hypothetical protein